MNRRFLCLIGNISLQFILLQALFSTTCQAFSSATRYQAAANRDARTRLYQDITDNNPELLAIKGFLAENYSALNTVLELNDKVWKALLSDDGYGFTIFAPSNAVFKELGETKLGQVMDPRNSETAQKLGEYHVIGERVTAEQLYNSGGIITLGGELPVDRSVSGGFGFGGVSLGGKEDGGVTVGGAKIVSSIEIPGNGIIHEVDGLISPNILWRYMDQLRIPGSS